MKAKPFNNQAVELEKSKNDIEYQNKCFLEASMNGGIWFSQGIDKMLIRELFLNDRGEDYQKRTGASKPRVYLWRTQLSRI